ncbi:retinol dehydrogenase 11-like [Ahaetulla prasina]|uniref:retinol dehydrogenase 11-like n=1 Tax=Ahaetulla prasina TaxID=499056 RepID=UPI002648FAA0|nr:retinol dehydrogenase 11-like [Ahaetulla prasina]
MEEAALFYHPLWFICSLTLLALLWAQRRKSWRPDACPVDLSGKTAIVTGASSGIGKAVALELANKNARTILACRCREKGQAVVEEIRRATGNPQVQLRLLDVSSMASVRDFARRFLEEDSQLHILVNNAGVTGLPFAVTTEGLELTFATNVSGAFLLTNLLLGTMVASTPARIVNVSSFRHFCVREVNLKWLTGEERPRNASQAYDCTKLMNVIFTMELARRLQGTGVSANVLSPGIVRTEILRHYGRASRLLYWLCSPFMRSPQKGATSTLYCAIAPEMEGISGKYFDSNCTLVLPQALAHEPGLSQRLWDALEKATGLKTDRSQQAVSGPLQREH